MLLASKHVDVIDHTFLLNKFESYFVLNTNIFGDLELCSQLVLSMFKKKVTINAWQNPAYLAYFIAN